MQQSATVIVIGGDRKTRMLDEVMHATGVFEKGKHAAQPMELALSHKKGSTESIDGICATIAQSFQETGGHVLFVGLIKVDGKPPKQKQVWFKEGIHSISMLDENHQSLGWGLFKDLIEEHGFVVTTDQRMRVTDVK